MQTIQITNELNKTEFKIGDIVRDHDGTFLITGKTSSYQVSLLMLPSLTHIREYDNAQELFNKNPTLKKINELKFEL